MMSNKTSVPVAPVPDTDQAMAVLTLGYTDYVVPIEAAVHIMNVLITAPRYKSMYVNGKRSYHIWNDMDAEASSSIQLISPHLYRIAKLAGEPDK